ncbi:hypothetical protein BESB_070500 [Besnoitia besnoiti]|uniref:Uncharacterized protein n=1 Tax=Besnoitia besnoiti TaxID=94643 RepID=A0A2A9M5Z1_BESBE|nr:uncharacterized protein BESB_070500 [Besnoitia besnoiti]PFH33898.1 hypothetical protein BESB_070500 [Besnoitia besnoiti]
MSAGVAELGGRRAPAALRGLSSFAPCPPPHSSVSLRLSRSKSSLAPRSQSALRRVRPSLPSARTPASPSLSPGPLCWRNTLFQVAACECAQGSALVDSTCGQLVQSRGVCTLHRSSPPHSGSFLASPSRRFTSGSSADEADSAASSSSSASSASASSASASSASASASASFSSSATAASAPSRFRSAAHRDMIVAMTRTHLQNLLLKRFGTFKTQECRVIAKPEFSAAVLRAWAGYLVDHNLRLDGEAGMRLAYAAPPAKVLKDPKVRELIRRDLEVRWLVDKLVAQNIAATEGLAAESGTGGGATAAAEEEELARSIERVKKADNVPQPHFPSVLKQDHPQFPYEPYELEKMRDLYGVLLKWPYREKGEVMSVTARRAEMEKKREERIRRGEEEAGEEGEGEGAEEDAHEVAGQLKVTTGCSDAYVYAPSELETGLYKEH